MSRKRKGKKGIEPRTFQIQNSTWVGRISGRGVAVSSVQLQFICDNWKTPYYYYFLILLVICNNSCAPPKMQFNDFVTWPIYFLTNEKVVRYMFKPRPFYKPGNNRRSIGFFQVWICLSTYTVVSTPVDYASSKKPQLKNLILSGKQSKQVKSLNSIKKH